MWEVLQEVKSKQLVITVHRLLLRTESPYAHSRNGTLYTISASVSFGRHAGHGTQGHVHFRQSLSCMDSSLNKVLARQARGLEFNAQNLHKELANGGAHV